MSLTNTPAPAPQDFVVTELRGIIEVCGDSPTAIVSVERMRLWLSKLRAPVADERAANPHIGYPDLADARATTEALDYLVAQAKSAASHWHVDQRADLIRAALASAPVAGEAQRPTDDELRDLAIKYDISQDAMRRWHFRDVVPLLREALALYAAPQASEAVRDAGIAASDTQLMAAAKGMTRLYPHVWDRADGALVVFPENVARFDAAFDTLRIAVGEAVDDDESAALSAQPGAQKACNCATCRPHSVEMRMILCETCGDKRCPHAADHRNECTGTGAQKGEQ